MKKRIIVIEDADDPESMKIMRNPYTGANFIFDSEEEARDTVLFLNPVQPVQFLGVDV